MEKASVLIRMRCCHRHASGTQAAVKMRVKMRMRKQLMKDLRSWSEGSHRGVEKVCRPSTRRRRFDC